MQICSSLDIKQALLNFLQLIRTYMPASKVAVGLFKADAETLRTLIVADAHLDTRYFPVIQMSKEAIQESKARASKAIRPLAPEQVPAVIKDLKPYIDLSNGKGIILELAVKGSYQGTLTVLAEAGMDFTKEHFDLIWLSREPLSLAMSNAVTYEDMVRLKDILDSENRELSRELRHTSIGGEIIGAERGLKNIMEMVRRVAPLDSPVILLGETGVGKEVIADVIHDNSNRRNGPLVKVNCGAIPDNLIDSELFGHERGAFTGAVAQRRGRFERADEGTIFLDEIAELPPPAQVRLLRVLQHKEIERVGGTKCISVKVRIVAATHRNMAELIRKGIFREDLWFRLNVFPITIPPLRQRKEDIPTLVHHFVKKKSQELKIYPPPSVSLQEMRRLMAYSWPGNVRELENLIERELIHRRGKDEGEKLTFDNSQMGTKGGELEVEHYAGPNLLTFDQAMSRHIEQALQLSNGKISGRRGAAQLLGINSNTLRSRMAKLGIHFEGENRGGPKLISNAAPHADLEPPISSDKRSSFDASFDSHALRSPETVAGLNRCAGVTLNDRQRAALLYLRQHGEITNKDYRGLNGVDVVKASRELQGLIEAGLANQIGLGRRTSYRLRTSTEKQPEQAGRNCEEQILNFVKEHGSISNTECRTLLGVDRRRASYLTDKMVAQGLLVAKGERRGVHYRLSRRVKKS